MPEEPVYYLDAIFASVRRFGVELAAARTWVGRAEATPNQGWRLSFLVEARRTRNEAVRQLAALVEQLALFGRSPPPPLDRVADRVVTMSRDLERLTARIGARETDAARAAEPIGQA